MVKRLLILPREECNDSSGGTSDTGQTSQIDLSITEPGDEIVFSIADAGVGMDKNSCDRIFSLFYSTKGRRGTGLGLFIANRIIGQHGGRITVASKPGEGSVFTVRIPPPL